MDTYNSDMRTVFLTNAHYDDVLVLISLILLFGAIGKFVRWKLDRRHMVSLAEKVQKPNVSCLPLIGHAHHFFGNSEDIFNFVVKLCESPTPCTVWLGPILVFNIIRPEDVKIILNSPHALAKSHLYNFGKVVVGEGLLTAPVPKWKRHKKLIIPMFSQKILESFVEIFDQQVNTLLQNLSKLKGTFNIVDLTAKCAIDVIVETAMGIRMDAQNTDCKFGTYLERALDLVSERIFHFMVHPDFIYRLTANYREERKTVKYIKDFVLKVVVETKQALAQKKKEDEDLEDTRKKFFLEYFLEAAQQDNTILTNQEITDEINTFLVAGIDTSSTAMGFVFLMLGMFPDIQQKTYEEVIAVLGDKEEVDFRDLPKFVYLDRVIKETLRVFPIATLVVRKLDEDIKLEYCTLPKGSNASLTTIGTHRSSLYYPDPLKFDPDRFLPEEVAKRHPYAYYPFTAGLRKCIGPRYSFMFMKTLISKVLRKFVVETDLKRVEDVRLKESLVTKSAVGYPIRLKTRDVQ